MTSITTHQFPPVTSSGPKRKRRFYTSLWFQVCVAISLAIVLGYFDPRTLWPLDEKTLIESTKKTSRAIVIDEGYHRYGVTAELASVIAEGAFYSLDGPVLRMGAMHIPIPFSPPLEDLTVATPRTVFETARRLCGKA